MLKKPTDELAGLQRHGFPECISGILVAEGDVVVGEALDAVVGDSDAVNVAGEVADDLFGLLKDRLAVDDPGFFPKLPRQGQLWESLFQPEEKAGAVDDRQRPNRDEEGAPCLMPDPLIVQTAPGDETMHVGVIDHGPCPSVQDAECADVPADVAGIGRESLHRTGGAAHQQRVERSLVRAHGVVQFMRQRENQMKIRHGQELIELSLEPAFGG